MDAPIVGPSGAVRFALDQARITQAAAAPSDRLLTPVKAAIARPR